MNIRQKERIFFFTHAITILSLFTYSVCDEKVKTHLKKTKFNKFTFTVFISLNAYIYIEQA